jgi:hypothetical protein
MSRYFNDQGPNIPHLSKGEVADLRGDVAVALQRVQDEIDGGAGAVAMDKTLFVGKHGDDGNEGTSMGAAMLTFAAAIAKAVTMSPADGAAWTIVCMDAGVYVESIVLQPWVHIFAPYAQIESADQYTITTAANSRVEFRRIKQTGTGNTKAAVMRPDTQGLALIIADRVDAENDTIAVLSLALSTIGILFVDVEQVWCETGVGIGDLSSAGHVHVDIEDLYVSGTGGQALVRGSAGSTIGRIAHILKIGPISSTKGIICTDGEVNLHVDLIATDEAYNIGAGGVMNLFVNSMTGTEVETGIANVSVPGGVRVFTDATRPNPGKKVGRVIFNSDDGQLNIDNGTVWTLPDGTAT